MPFSVAKTKRNKRLYNDWKKGMSVVDMVAKYRISSAAIYAIINRLKEKGVDNTK